MARRRRDPKAARGDRRSSKPQYSKQENLPLVRMQVLVPRSVYDRLERWKQRTGQPKAALINRAIARELDRDGRRVRSR